MNKLGLNTVLENPQGSTLIKIYDKNPELSFMMIIFHKGYEDIASINVELGYYDTYKISQLVMELTASGIKCVMSRCFIVDTSGNVLFDKEAYAFIQSMIDEVDELSGMDETKVKGQSSEEELDEEDSHGTGDHLIFPNKKIPDGRGQIH